ncbi:MAG: Spy/CpxP family protein refolding chaperone, partial [Parahaliea sp.]
MKHMMKNTLTATGLSIALLTAGLAVAHPDRQDMPPSRSEPAHMMERMARKLDLSEEQQAQIRQVFDNSRKDSAADHERLRELRASLREDGDGFDSQAVQKIADEIGVITSRMTYRMASTQHQVRQVLTEEQRVEMAKMKERMQKRDGKQRRPKHGEHRPKDQGERKPKDKAKPEERR